MMLNALGNKAVAISKLAPALLFLQILQHLRFLLLFLNVSSTFNKDPQIKQWQDSMMKEINTVRYCFEYGLIGLPKPL